MIREVPLHASAPHLPRAAFVALTAWSRLHEANTGAPEAMRRALHPLVLMVLRWDGTFGFPGGKTEPGETLRDAAVREAGEEANIHLHPDSLSVLCAHEDDGYRVTLYHAKMEADLFHRMHGLRLALQDAPLGRDAITKGCAVWAHLSDYGCGAGWPRLRASNNLATAVAEELDLLRAKLYAEAPAGAWPADGKV